MHEILTFLLKPRNPTILSTSFAAFSGALFGFVFSQVSTLISQLEKRKFSNYMSLVEAERILVESTSLLDINRKVLKELPDSMSKLQIYPKGLIHFAVPNVVKLDLLNLTLLNEISTVYLRLQQYNYEWDVISEIYSETKILLLKDVPLSQIDDQRLNHNVEYLVDRIQRVSALYREFCIDYMMCLARIQSQIDLDRPLLVRIRNRILKLRIKKNSDNRAKTYLSRILRDQEKLGSDAYILEITKDALKRVNVKHK